MSCHKCQNNLSIHSINELINDKHACTKKKKISEFTTKGLLCSTDHYTGASESCIHVCMYCKDSLTLVIHPKTSELNSYLTPQKAVKWPLFN